MCLEVTAIPIDLERVPASTDLMVAESPTFREVSILMSLEVIAIAIVMAINLGRAPVSTDLMAAESPIFQEVPILISPEGIAMAIAIDLGRARVPTDPKVAATPMPLGALILISLEAIAMAVNLVAVAVLRDPRGLTLRDPRGLMLRDLRDPTLRGPILTVTEVDLKADATPTSRQVVVPMCLEGCQVATTPIDQEIMMTTAPDPGRMEDLAAALVRDLVGVQLVGVRMETTVALVRETTPYLISPDLISLDPRSRTSKNLIFPKSLNPIFPDLLSLAMRMRKALVAAFQARTQVALLVVLMVEGPGLEDLTSVGGQQVRNL